MEIGAVIAAAPASNVRREAPAPGDIVILLGRHQRGATAAAALQARQSRTHLKSLESCGAEVQKGNAPEERKLQRLFRNPEAMPYDKALQRLSARAACRLRSASLADGLDINLNAVPKKYDGLDGTELAISESQERMAVVVAPADVEEFLKLADSENLQAVPVAAVYGRTPPCNELERQGDC